MSLETALFAATKLLALNVLQEPIFSIINVTHVLKTAVLAIIQLIVTAVITDSSSIKADSALLAETLAQAVFLVLFALFASTEITWMDKTVSA